MADIQLWQTASFGVLIAAVVTAASAWVQAGLTRRRDDRLEARRTRVEAGVDSIRAAYRAYEAALDVVHSAAIAEERRAEQSAHVSKALKRQVKDLQKFQRELVALTEQRCLSKALAAKAVAIALYEFEVQVKEHVLRVRNSSDLRPMAHYEAALGDLIHRLTEEVRIDAQTDLGRTRKSRTRSASSDHHDTLTRLADPAPGGLPY